MKILSKPRGNAEEYGRWSVNPYKGCTGGCTYCYLKKGVWKNELGKDIPVLKKGIERCPCEGAEEGSVEGEVAVYHIARNEIRQHKEEILRDGGLFMSFITDPCLPETRWVFFSIASACAILKVPAMILTKRADFTTSQEYRSLIIPYLFCGIDRILAFGWSLTGHDELEPGASKNDERIAAMQQVHNDGFKVWASIEPVIDFPSSFDMIQKALDAGCQHFKIGLMTSDTHVCRDKYDLQDCLDFISKVMDATADRATVYWKQSFRDFLGHDLEFHLDIDGHSVGKDWSLFNQ